jgi:hypothetical protein
VGALQAHQQYIGKGKVVHVIEKEKGKGKNKERGGKGWRGVGAGEAGLPWGGWRWHSGGQAGCALTPGSLSRPMKKAWVVMPRSLEVSWEVELVVAVREVRKEVGAHVREGLSKLSRAMERQSSMLCELLLALERRLEGRSGRRLVRGRGTMEVQCKVGVGADLVASSIPSQSKARLYRT